MSAEDWFHNDVITGLQALVGLQLAGTPAAEVVKVTATLWTETLWSARVWDQQLDQARLQEAFRRLMLAVDRWPAPRHLLDQLPPRPAAGPALPPPITKPNPEALAKLAALSRSWAATQAKEQPHE